MAAVSTVEVKDAVFCSAVPPVVVSVADVVDPMEDVVVVINIRPFAKEKIWILKRYIG